MNEVVTELAAEMVARDMLRKYASPPAKDCDHIFEQLLIIDGRIDIVCAVCAGLSERRIDSETGQTYDMLP